MAKRESQGMQIAVILLVMFCLIFAITTVVFWNLGNKANAALAQAKESQTQAEAAMRKASDENLQLLKWLGYPDGSTVESAKAQVDKDLSLFGKNYPEEQRNYRELPAFLVKTVQDQHQRLYEAANLENELKGERNQAREEERRNVKLAEDNHQKAAQDLKMLQDQFAGDIEKLRQQQKAREDSFKAAQESAAKENTNLTQHVKELESQLKSLEQQNERLNTELVGFRTESFEHPDGNVTWVNQSLGTVYLDLGSADMLRPQATFSVYEVDSNNLARAEKKASIEVTRILGSHLAEARILDDEPSRPIITGDIVYSPVFHKGIPVHFAIAGVMGRDGDGPDQRELIRGLIRINGGVIDAEVDEQGKRTGDISIETRYLIMGQEITEKTPVELREALTRILGEAEKAGVTVISVDRFLNNIGYAGSIETLRLGAVP